MLYATQENFQPSYGLGTVFCNKKGEIQLRSACHHMRFVLFEGDILHSIEESHIPEELHTWRISYVFKLIVNPRKPQVSMKKLFFEWLNGYIKKGMGGDYATG